MKILIIEPDYHPEVVGGIISLLKNTTVEVGLVTRESIYKKIKIDRPPKTVYLLERGSLSDFFEREKILLKQWDGILFTTAQTNFKELCKLKLPVPVVVIVHNVHAYFDRSKIQLSLKPFFIWKDLSFLLRIIFWKRDSYFRNKFLDKVDYFLFPSSFMYRYAKRHYPLEASRFISEPISWVYPKWNKGLTQKKFVGISIIGTIDKRRRDYGQIIRLIEFLKKNSNTNIKVTLAGKPAGFYGNMIVKRLKSLQSNNIEILTFNSFIPQKRLLEVVAETDIFIAPIVEKTRHHIWTEFYGKTKISGNINNVIEFWKPMFIPSFYPIEAEMQQIITPYRTQDDLNDKVLHTITSHDFKRAETPEVFSKNSMQLNLLGIIHKILT